MVVSGVHGGGAGGPGIPKEVVLSTLPKGIRNACGSPSDWRGGSNRRKRLTATVPKDLAAHCCRRQVKSFVWFSDGGSMDTKAASARHSEGEKLGAAIAFFCTGGAGTTQLRTQFFMKSG